MPQRMDYVLHAVEIAGVDCSNILVDSEVNHDYQIRMSDCRITFDSLPPSANYNATVKVWAGLHSNSGDTASDLASAPNGLLRFDGFLTDFDFNDWPNTVSIKGNGPLWIMERLLCPDDAEATKVALADPLAIPSTYDPPGIDLSANPDTGDPWTDADIVAWLVGQAGLTGRVGSAGIGGTGRIIGSIAYDQVLWRRGQSALSAADDFDKVCLGFRLVEALEASGHTIVRVNTSPRSPFESTSYTLTGGADIGFDEEPARLNQNALQAKNRAVVQGYDAGGGPEVAVSIGSVDTLPPGITYDTIELSSPLIEKSFVADTGDGLACDEVGGWLLDERSKPLLDAEVPTWRDDRFSPGQVIYLNDPNLAVNQTLWCRGVRIRTTGDSFTQILTLRDRAQRDLEGRSLLPMSLPSSLAVNP